jgi:hypothetical protein
VREHVEGAHGLERVAAVHELAGVGCERRGVARHVDEPLGGELEHAPHRLGREARTGRVDEDHVRPGHPLEQRADALRHVARDELGVPDPVAGGVLARARDRLLRDLDAVHRARMRGRQQADGAGAAVEIPHHVARPQLRQLDRERVEPLGHGRVRLHEGPRGDRELQPADALGEPVAAEQQRLVEADRDLGHARVHRVDDARDPLRDELRQALDPRYLARGGHEHRQQLAGAPALAHDEVAQVAPAAALVVRGQAELGRPPLEGAADVVGRVRGYVAVVDGDQAVPAAEPVVAEPRPAGPFRPRVLDLVAVAVEILGRDHGLRLEAVEPADPLERVGDLRVLVAQLLGVPEVLPGTAAADAEVRAAGLHPARPRLEQLDRLRLGVPALELRDAGADAVAGEPAGDEDDQLAVPGDAAAAVREPVDPKLDLLTTRDACHPALVYEPPCRSPSTPTAPASRR